MRLDDNSFEAAIFLTSQPAWKILEERLVILLSNAIAGAISATEKPGLQNRLLGNAEVLQDLVNLRRDMQDEELKTRIRQKGQ